MHKQKTLIFTHYITYLSFQFLRNHRILQASSLELASIVSQNDTHLLANIVFICKHCEILCYSLLLRIKLYSLKLKIILYSLLIGLYCILYQQGLHYICIKQDCIVSCITQHYIVQLGLFYILYWQGLNYKLVQAE